MKHREFIAPKKIVRATLVRPPVDIAELEEALGGEPSEIRTSVILHMVDAHNERIYFDSEVLAKQWLKKHGLVEVETAG